MALKDRNIEPTKTCVMARLLSVMTKEDIATTTSWVKEGVPTSRITLALREEYNITIHDKSLVAHTRGRCMCTDTKSVLFGISI